MDARNMSFDDEDDIESELVNIIATLEYISGCLPNSIKLSIERPTIGGGILSVDLAKLNKQTSRLKEVLKVIREKS